MNKKFAAAITALFVCSCTASHEVKGNNWTEEEWNIDGRPDGEKIGLKTYFLTVQFMDKSFNENFIVEFEKLNIGHDQEILTMCMGGARSQAAAELIEKKNYKCCNIADGFLGNSEHVGWKRNNLPCK